MERDDIDYLFECIEDIQDTVHENNLMLHQICDVINFHHARHHQENEEDFGRNVLANIVSQFLDINKGKKL